LLYSVARVVADPAEDSDRRFLKNLENGTAAQAAQANSSAITDPASQNTNGEKSANSGKTAKRNHKHQPAPVGQSATVPSVAFGGGDAPVPAPTPPGRIVERRVTFVRTPGLNADHDHDQGDHRHNFFHRLFGNLFKDANPDDW
jgi:hypothetical protein